MQTKTFIDEAELNKFVEELANNDNTIDVIPKSDGTYVVNWIKNKLYTTYDGKEFTDEVWVTVDGKMIHVQDLEPAHAKNIIRMMIRNKRQLMQQAAAVFEELTKEWQENSVDEALPTFLH